LNVYLKDGSVKVSAQSNYKFDLIRHYQITSLMDMKGYTNQTSFIEHLIEKEWKRSKVGDLIWPEITYSKNKIIDNDKVLKKTYFFMQIDTSKHGFVNLWISMDDIREITSGIDSVVSSNRARFDLMDISIPIGNNRFDTVEDSMGFECPDEMIDCTAESLHFDRKGRGFRLVLNIDKNYPNRLKVDKLSRTFNIGVGKSFNQLLKNKVRKYLGIPNRQSI